MYLHTTGTSLDELVIRLTAVSTSGIYYKNTQKQTLSLTDEVESVLVNTLQKQFNTSFKRDINSSYDYELLTRDIDSIQFTIDKNCSLELNNNGVLLPLAMGTYEYFTKNIDTLKFYNDTAETLNIWGLIDGILPNEQPYSYDYFTVDYAE